MNEHAAIRLPLDAYDVDVYAWTRTQADLLRSKSFEAIDLDSIVEEIESLGNEQAHAIESHLIITVENLRSSRSRQISSRAEAGRTLSAMPGMRSSGV